MKRTKHSLSYYKLATFNMGKLVPVACLPVLPGDSIQQASSCLLRVSPLLRPVMHPIQVRMHHFYVPYRLVWSEWEQFITGGQDGEGDGAVYPTITGNFAAKGLGDYLGVPPGVANTEVSALAFRAYGLIANQYYLDQDLQTPRVIDLTGGADTTTDLTLADICWEKDLFTQARPWPQKGPDITLPLGTTAPVVTTGVNPQLTFTGSGGNRTLGVDAAGDLVQAGGANPGGTVSAFWADPTGLQADLSSATAVNVNDVRRAFALQRFAEARAQYGSNYVDYLAYLGIRSSDARLQRAEYLGGGKQTIAFSEVLQTGPDSADDGVADLKGHGIAAMRSRRYRRFFEEHGVILTLMSVRPKTMYVTGLDREFSKRTKEDYFQKELELIGQQEVYNRELYTADSAPGDVFGYSDRYAEYRHRQSEVSGEFRNSSMYDWHLGRIFASDVALNSSFVTCSPSDRIFADQTVGADHLWCMISHSIQARRMVSRRTIGRIL